MKKHETSPSRRDFLRQAGAGTALVAMSAVLAPRISTAAGDLPKLDPGDAQASALEYTHESSMEGKHCSNCHLWQGGNEAWGGCAIFPGKAVSAKGWCKSWVMKSG